MRCSDTNSRTLDKVVSVRSAARLRAFRRDVELAFPGMIDSMLLFGSRARGEARRDSDYDVAVLFKGGQRPATVRALLSDAAYRHMLAGVHIRPLAVLVEHVSKDGPLPVCRNIARDGIAIR
jgi:predicted nucleotidyltransferase